MRSIVLALLLTPVVLGATEAPASAEPLRPETVGLPPFEIVAIMRSRGFEPLGRPVRGAGVFFVRALDPADNDVRLTIDARSGRILAVRSMTVMAPAYRPPFDGGYPVAYRRPFDGAAGFEDATGALPVPPRAVPGGSAALGRKSTLPLPRPRPQAIAAVPPMTASSPQTTAAKPDDIAMPRSGDAAPPAADTPAAGRVELPPVTPLE